jgi:hypothetical protein
MGLVDLATPSKNFFVNRENDDAPRTNIRHQKPQF